MEFREARSLAVLAQTESIAKTAKIVNLTPAAVHKQLKNLEAELGVRLYEKSGRSIHLTQAARVLLPHLEELLSTHDALNAAVTEWKGLRSGFIRIGVNPATSTVLLPSLLRDFRALWPRITVALDVDTGLALSNRVANRSLDLALGLWDDPGHSRVISRACWEYPIVPLASPDLGFAGTRLRDLSSYVHIRLPAQGSILSGWIDAHLKRHDCRPSETLIANNAHTIAGLLCAGLGFGLLPLWTVAAEVEAGRLRVLPCSERPLAGTLDLIGVKSGYISPPVQAFIDLARGHTAWSRLGLTLRKPKKVASA